MIDDKKLMVRVCEISLLDHAWSGDCSVRFNACDGPDANLLMWNFFVLHRRAVERFVHVAGVYCKRRRA